MADLFDDTETQVLPPAEAAKKQCKHCGNEISGTSRKEFCNDRCRGNYHKNHSQKPAPEKMQSENEPIGRAGKQTHLHAALHGLQPSAQYIIYLQETKIKELKDLIDKKDKQIDELENEIDELEDQVSTKETELKGIENAAPPWWQSLLQQLPPEVVTKVLSGVYEKVEKLMTPSAPVAGIGGQLDEPMQKIMGEWYSNLSDEHKQNVYRVLAGLANIPNEQALKAKILQVLNIIGSPAMYKNGAATGGGFQYSHAYGG